MCVCVCVCPHARARTYAFFFFLRQIYQSNGEYQRHPNEIWFEYPTSPPHPHYVFVDRFLYLCILSPFLMVKRGEEKKSEEKERREKKMERFQREVTGCNTLMEQGTCLSPSQATFLLSQRPTEMSPPHHPLQDTDASSASLSFFPPLLSVSGAGW